MKLISLNIRYDPEYPFDWVSMEQQQFPELNAPKPLFPFRGFGRQGHVSVLGVHFNYHHRTTRGFDPYAGEEWTCTVGPFELLLSSVVCSMATLEFHWQARGKLWLMLMKSGEPTFVKRALFDVREYRQADMPWLVRKLWDFLEYRRAWFEANTPEPEDDFYCEE